MNLNLKTTVSALALTLCFVTQNALSMDELTVQGNQRVQNNFNQIEVNQYTQYTAQYTQYTAKYVPQELERGAFEALRCGFSNGTHATLVNGVHCIVPESVSGVDYIMGAQQQPVNQGALTAFQKLGNIPQYGLTAERYFSTYGGLTALESLNESREYNKVKFEKIYLNKCESYCERINGYFAMIGFKVSYQYFGLIENQYGLCTTPDIIFLLSSEDYRKINQEVIDHSLEGGFEVMPKLEDLDDKSLLDCLVNKVPKSLGRFALSDLAEKPQMTIKSRYDTDLECIIFGSRKNFKSKVPHPQAYITQTMHPNLILKGEPSIHWENGKPIGVQATYKYTGRDAYTITYNDVDRELPVLFKFTQEEALIIQAKIPCPMEKASRPVRSKWEPSWTDDNRPIKVLSLDGGGIRGIGEAEMLRDLGERIRKEKGKQLHEEFDVIVGTSTGGILGIAIGMGIDHNELYKIYVDNAQEIFQKVGNQYTGVQYDHNNLKNVLKKYLREKTGMENPPLSLAGTHVAVTTYESDRQHTCLLTSETAVNGDLENMDTFISAGNVSSIKVARTTSSAPTYFKGTNLNIGALETPAFRKLGKSYLFVDGGVTKNRPIGLAYQYTSNLQERGILPQNREIQILSLGTGFSKVNGFEADAGGLNLVANNHLLNHIGDGSQIAAFESDLKFLRQLKVSYFVHNFYLQEPIDLAAKDKLSLMILRLAGIDETRTEAWEASMKTLLSDKGKAF
jgi:predicted acylesterase/phospholipase RssA